MITKVDVYFNDEKIQIKTLLDYSGMYDIVNMGDMQLFKDEKYEIVLGTSTTGNFEQFIDSVLTGIDKIEVFRFTREDIVRNDILIKIAEKYEQFTEKTEKQNNRGNIG
jgi:hypothetical protein